MARPTKTACAKAKTVVEVEQLRRDIENEISKLPERRQKIDKDEEFFKGSLEILDQRLQEVSDDAFTVGDMFISKNQYNNESLYIVMEENEEDFTLLKIKEYGKQYGVDGYLLAQPNPEQEVTEVSEIKVYELSKTGISKSKYLERGKEAWHSLYRDYNKVEKLEALVTVPIYNVWLNMRREIGTEDLLKIAGNYSCVYCYNNEWYIKYRSGIMLLEPIKEKHKVDEIHWEE